MTKYYINDEEINKDDFYNQLGEDTREESEDGYDASLDYAGDVVIGGLSYAPSYVLEQVDEIAYNCGFDDYVDSLISDYQYELDKGEEITVNGNTFKIEEE